MRLSYGLSRGHPAVQCLAGLYWIVAALVVACFFLPQFYPYSVTALLWIGCGLLAYLGVFSSVVLGVLGILLWKMHRYGWWGVTGLTVLNFIIVLIFALMTMMTDQWISVGTSFFIIVMMVVLKAKFHKKKRF